jgi:uncharacterized alpha-E superfamily protein
MLSRVAEAIYWAGRYIERAENTARLVRVNSHLVLDTPTGISPGWAPLISITGLGPQFDSCCQDATERNVVRFLIGDLNNPSSILSSLKAARENCRTIREVLPRSGWEALNELYIFAKDNIQSGLTKKGRDDYLDGIISGSQQLIGLLGSIMYRDEAFYFLRIGRNLERADMTTRILDVRSTDLLPDADDLFESRSLESVQWISILKSLSAYSIYRRKIAVRVSREPVLEFLLHDTEFPRAFAHCILAVEESVGPLPNSGLALKSLRKLEGRLSRQKVGNLRNEELHAFLDKLQLGIIRFHSALEKQYFLPTVA